MSKARQKALEKFPILFSERMGYDKINLQQERRNAYEKGYHQAEKDLELSWEDLALMRLAFDATEDNINHGCLKISPMTKEYYQEVLKRYKDFKERKEK